MPYRRGPAYTAPNLRLKPTGTGRAQTPRWEPGTGEPSGSVPGPVPGKRGRERARRGRVPDSGKWGTAAVANSRRHRLSPFSKFKVVLKLQLNARFNRPRLIVGGPGPSRCPSECPRYCSLVPDFGKSGTPGAEDKGARCWPSVPASHPRPNRRPPGVP